MMSGTQLDSALDTMEEILVKERDLLLTGRAAETADLVKEKMSALQVFDSMLIGQSQENLAAGQRNRIEKVVSLARENSLHFSAVRNGLKSAIGRLESLTENAYVGSYRLDGERTPFPKATGGYV